MDTEQNGTIEVFGSATLTVAPDGVVVDLGVERSDAQPERAFAEANEGSASVLRFLRSVGVEDVRSSKITLRQVTQWEDKRKVITYSARIGHQVRHGDLEQVESLLVGAVQAGANELQSVKFVTSELKELRRTARRDAIHAAREKAELYAEAAGVELSGVVAIRDTNPDGSARPGSESRSRGAGSSDAVDSGAIEVMGKVRVWYRIHNADA